MLFGGRRDGCFWVAMGHLGRAGRVGCGKTTKGDLKSYNVVTTAYLVQARNRDMEAKGKGKGKCKGA